MESGTQLFFISTILPTICPFLVFQSLKTSNSILIPRSFFLSFVCLFKFTLK